MNDIQKELKKLYLDYLETIFSDKMLYEQVLNFKVSSPLLLDCTVEFGKYLDSDFKVLYVGQESNYWFNQYEREKTGLIEDIKNTEKYLNALLNLYNNFNNGHDYQSDFFTFMDILTDKLRSKKQSTGILWTSLLRHDSYGEGKVPSDVEHKITYNNNYIFRKELSILKPDVIIFVTGPNYDYLLENSFFGLEKIKFKSEPVREICLFKHQDLPDKSVRVYHPNAYKYKGAGYRWELADTIIEIIGKALIPKNLQ